MASFDLTLWNRLGPTSDEWSHCEHPFITVCGFAFFWHIRHALWEINVFFNVSMILVFLWCWRCQRCQKIKCYLCQRCQKMLKMVLHIFAHNFLDIQPIFNPKKTFGKLTLRAFQSYHQMLSMSKVSKKFWPLTPSTCFNIDRWYGWKALSLSFPKLFWIENQLNIKKVMGKNIMSPYSVFWVSFDTFSIHSITALTVYFELLLTPSTYIAFDQLFIAQYSISHL